MWRGVWRVRERGGGHWELVDAAAEGERHNGRRAVARGERGQQHGVRCEEDWRLPNAGWGPTGERASAMNGGPAS
eukprot:2019443-Prymnesium_polylepis.1